jgi:hypothetical protein
LNSDKNEDVLEKQFKILGQKIRIDILKKLSLSSAPLPYSSLKKEVLGRNPNSINFSFHLKALKKSVLIESSDNGYMLSLLGKQILKNIVSIEQILNNNNKTIMIRTSKYSKEPFDINKIEAYLIKEGEVERSEAEQIAREVEERLSKTNINYLTTPLMREYINAILLENGREEIRHKLTRLGTPPFEVHKSFDNPLLSPEQILSKLGSDVSEQFLLLNLIPKNLADLYLSGEIVLLNLNYWSLRPLALQLDTKAIVNYVQDRYSIKMEKNDLKLNTIRLITHFFDMLAMISPYFSEDILLCNFFEPLLINQNCNVQDSQLLKILMSQLFNHNRRTYDAKSHLSLEISNHDLFFDEIFNQIGTSEESAAPLILFDYNKLNATTNTYNRFIQNIKLGNCFNFIFHNKKKSNLLNSTLISATNSNDDKSIENRIVLDKILINLHKIAEESNQNDAKFFEKLQKKLDSVFNLFSYKKELVNRKLKSSNRWTSIISAFIQSDNAKCINNALKSVSFFGFNEAVKTHCGIEIDRIEPSESFALKILGFMRKLIGEKNQDESESFILTQPHNDSYLYDAWHNTQHNLSDTADQYSINIVREDSKAPLNRKIELYNKFGKLLRGGSLFTLGLDKICVEDQLDVLIKSKINAFQLKI